MRISHLLPDSMVDGPGHRAVLFVQGCSLACPACQNVRLWSEAGGYEAKPEEVALRLAALNPRSLTISGGEPLQQAVEVARVCQNYRYLARYFGYEAHIILYTGHVWGNMAQVVEPRTLEILLALVDVVVDGPFVRGLDHARMQWRGSSNQRAIDVRATRATGRLVVLDWDTVTLTATDDGVLAVAGVADFLPDWKRQATRKCGQTKDVR